jgi:UDP-glucose 4-epimerase
VSEDTVRVESPKGRAAIERAVVTGAAGFIGRHLSALLVQRGVELVTVDRNPHPVPDGRSLTRDLARPGALDDLLDSRTTVFHLASPADVSRSVAEPRREFEHNLTTSFEVLESVRRAGAALVFASSASVFDPAGDERPRGERAYPRPSSPYAAAKLAGEAYCYAYHRSYGVDVKVARMFSVYGVGMRRFAIYDLFHKIRRDPARLTLLGDGEQVRDYLYVEDAARGLLAVAAAGAPGEDYNLASGVAVPVAELARCIAVLMGHPDISIEASGEPYPGDVRCFFADTGKLSALGFAPQIPLDEGLRRTLDWLALDAAGAPG